MRHSLFILTFVLMYVVLRGLVGEVSLWWRAVIAVLVLLIGLWGTHRRFEKCDYSFKSVRKIRLLDGLVLLVVIGVVEGLATSTLVLSDHYVSGSHGGEGGDGEGEVRDEWLWDEDFEREIPKQSDHKPKSHPEVLVKAVDEGTASWIQNARVYLSGFSFDTFENDSWKSSSRFEKVWQAEGPIQLSEQRSTQGFTQYRHEVSLNKNGNGQDVAFAIQGVQRMDVEQLRQVADGVFLLPESDQVRYRYTASSVPLNYQALAMRVGEIEVGSPGEKYLQLPEKVRELQGPLLVGLVGEVGLYQKLEGVKQLLQSRCKYSLKVDNTEGLGSMENFLFGDRVGYCEHFASASALMARQLGIPSRVVYGYAGGTLYSYADTVVFRSRDAHAWAEVYLDGYGWTMFDTTPSAEIETEVAAASESLPSLDTPYQEGMKGERRGAPWGIIALVICGLGGLVVVVNVWKSSTEKSILSGGKREVEMAHYLQAFYQACRVKGVHRVESSTMREIVEQLERMEKAPDWLDELVEYYHGVEYREQSPDRQEERRLQKLVQGWE
ncbi:DUF4129 domain-containing transglutaminase family protein [Rubritalea tangerina]|uniref:DUF4129 domain-containing transglutaminase family protein n=2 Tax=Rubritalea tangerina TaxID=430798 RepID=A0ABW4ZE51_9BACT